MRFLPIAVAAASLATLALIPRQAHAFEFVETGVGVIAKAGANFIGKPSDLPANSAYGGFSGFTGGAGLALDFRVLHIVGLELDVIRSTDKGKTTITTTSAAGSISYDLTIGQSATHVPLLLKVVAPVPLIAPMIFVGPEFVFPSDGSASTSVPVSGGTYLAHADKYTALTAGFGFELKLPLPIVDIRVPFSLRYSHYGISDHFVDRVAYTQSPVTATYSSQWQHSVTANLAAQIYF